jgi:hypothetical protein
MTSTRKMESNKRNASRSTGPRTPGGKLSSRDNARRHGLAARRGEDRDEREGIERLTAILAEGSDNFSQVERAKIVAECHFDLRRIRTARLDLFLRIKNLENAGSEDFEIAVRAMESINRYERRALSRRKQALRGSND